MHPNCPNTVAATGQLLSQWIAEHPASVGEAVRRRFGAVLPFLFKVLSVNKALSIQSHPDKQLAERLHRDFPKVRTVALGRGRSDAPSSGVAAAQPGCCSLLAFQPPARTGGAMATNDNPSQPRGHARVSHCCSGGAAASA